ncbi:MAG: RNA polymerase factor sigma-54 [Thioalkalispiraceae bacterium]|jgi:RNA polymerase sigma-54 factor
MKQALQLRLGQHLTMTPQLQQAIKLLQLSTLELQQEIQEALDSNLMLEIAEEGENEGENQAKSEDQAESASTSSDQPEQDSIGTDSIPDDLPVDSAWDDIYENIQTAPSGSSSYQESDRELEVGDTNSESLQEHLRWQMQLTPFSDTDLLIADAIIDAIDDDGFLRTSIEEIHQMLPADMEIELDEVEAVLHRVQNFDPPGVGARNVQESLLLQLRQVADDSWENNTVIKLISEYFDLLVNRDFNQLMRKLNISEEALKDIIEIIQSLNPRPGSQITASKAEYVIPDVIVRKIKGKWRVELNPEAAPRIRINAQYASLAKQARNSEDSTYLKNHLQEARWFIKSLASRNETLLKVATCIVERQRAFLEYGEEAMKALVLHDIAEAVDMHESTISRVTTKKYMHTPRGVFELKYFFSSHVSTADGGECSATAIRALIKKLIAAEAPAKPLSDSKIANLLSEQGINVARRTVAKYREAMAIPPSNERKRLA